MRDTESLKTCWWLKYFIGGQKKKCTPEAPTGSDTASPFHCLPNSPCKHQAYGTYWTFCPPSLFFANGQILTGEWMWVWSAILPRNFSIYRFISKVSVPDYIIVRKLNKCTKWDHYQFQAGEQEIWEWGRDRRIINSIKCEIHKDSKGGFCLYCSPAPSHWEIQPSQ